MFLHDADISTGIKAYSPEEIRNKLQLTSLLPFAFALLDGPQDTANDLVCNARSVDKDSARYHNFANRYIIQSVEPARVSASDNIPLNIPYLDVRVSEFVLQALSNSKAPFVYLPLLIEDPSQASAWSAGCDVRTLAYSLLASDRMVINEYRRKAQAVSTQEIATYSSADLLVPIKELEQKVSSLIEWATVKALEPALLWPLFALSLVLAELKSTPEMPLVLHVLNGDFDNSWAFVQLMARLQAALYSLRIFSQIARVCLKVTPKVDKKLSGYLISLDQCMRSLPSIPDGFGVLGQSKRVLANHNELTALVEEIYLAAGVQVPTEQISNKKKKRQAREADRKQRKAAHMRQSRQETTNSYTMLSDNQI